MKYGDKKSVHGLKPCTPSVAESEGFKPPIPERGIPDFESSAFGHSANFPYCGCKSSKIPGKASTIVAELSGD